MERKIEDKLSSQIFKTLVLMFLFSTQLFSSTNNWQTVSMPNVGTFKIPPSMEIQAGTYKEKSDDFQRNIQLPFDERRIIIQQKRLNQFDKKAFQTFARILIETDYGQVGDYENITTRINPSPKELQELDTALKKELEESFLQINNTGQMTMKLVSWKPLKIVQINGVSMIKAEYTRTVNNGPEATVNMFLIQNNDRMYRITVSYRQADANLWKHDLDKVIYTFKFNRK